MEYSSCLDTEISKTSKLQEELYGEDGSEVHSIFYWEYVRKARSGHMYLKMTRKPRSDDYSFEVDNKHFNYLLYSELWQSLPEIRVAPKFKDIVQVSWPSNVGLNLVRRANLSTETSTIQSIDNVWILMHAQHFMNLDRQHFFRLIGNVRELTEWNTRLPAYQLTVPQCWDYCRDYGRALPIGLAREDTISHLYEMRRKISSLLRIRVKQDDKWIETKLSACRFKEPVLVGLDSDTDLPAPELYGCYGKSLPSELEWRSEQPNLFYTHDVIEIPDQLRHEAGKRFQIPLEIEAPCVAIFFAAEPIKALDSNNYSNYTNDPSNIEAGGNPFSRVALMYGNSYRLPEISAHYTSELVPARFFPITPYHRGYNVISIGFSPNAIDTDVTSSLKTLNAKMVLELSRPGQEEEEAKDDDILIRPLDDSQGKGPFYDIHVRLLVYRKISFSNGRCVVEGVNT